MQTDVKTMLILLSYYTVNGQIISNPLLFSVSTQKTVFCVLSAELVCQLTFWEWQEMTAGHYYLPLSDTSLAADMSACGIWGIWWYSYTCSHVSEGIKTYVTVCRLSWANVILGLLEIMALPVHSLLHFTLWIISLLALRFTLIHPNISTGGSSTASPSRITQFRCSLF